MDESALLSPAPSFDPKDGGEVRLPEAQAPAAGTAVGEAVVCEIPIRGMHCASCAERIGRVLSRLEGVEAEVDLLAERARLHLAPGASPERAAEAIRKAGYEPVRDRHELQSEERLTPERTARLEAALRRIPGVIAVSFDPAGERVTVEGFGLSLSALIAAAAELGIRLVPRTAEETGRRREVPWEALRLGLGVAATLPLLGTMFGLSLPLALQAGLAALVQFGVGYPFYQAAWRALRGGGAGMDLLVVLGTSAAFFYSLFTALSGGAGPLSFEAGAVVITVVTLGRFLEGRGKRASDAALRALLALRPDTAHLERGGKVFDIPAAALGLGDVVLIRPGERVPADGLILSGTSALDESLLSGESTPVLRGPGEAVAAGALNGAGLLRVRVTAVGAGTRLARIAAAVARAQASRAPIQRLVDRVSLVFVPAVLLIALVAAAGWLWAGAPERALVAAVAVLVSACPCALGLATPTALAVGFGVAARHGILIRDTEAIERSRHLDTVIFDKTGTLTRKGGELTLIPAPGVNEARLLILAAAAEQGSGHPLAEAIRAEAARRGLSLPVPARLETDPRGGIRAEVGGEVVALGALRFLAALAPEAAAALAGLAGEGGEGDAIGVVRLSPEPAALGVIRLAEAIQPEAAAAIAELRRLGLTPLLLSGDGEARTREVAATLGISSFRARVAPEEKAAVVEALRAEGRRVGMVGDGINDAPALAAADLGIALGSGADAALAAAGMALLRDDLRLVPAVLRLCRAIERKIRSNLFWAFFYNGLTLPLAALGKLDPMLAGTAMAFSSVSVVANALLLRRWRP
jgi:Cu+-exporting ATPase